MSWRTNHRTRKRFPVIESAGMPQTIPRIGSIIPDAPDIIGFEYAGSVYVEDGDGSRYTVKYLDGHTADVEFANYFDQETGDEMVSVIWDGALDFEESYNDDTRSALIGRYGKIAKDWLR